MASDSISRLKRIQTLTSEFLAEKDLASLQQPQSPRLRRFAHFWLLVGKSFVRNRCMVRASALAYTTLLALVPLLAVAVSVTTSMLQKQGEEPIRELIDTLVDYVAPALDLEVKEAPAEAPEIDRSRLTEMNDQEFLEFLEQEYHAGNAKLTGRERVVKQISGFVANINSGTLTFTSVAALLFVAISLLRTIEGTFNDIWGVTQGRGWIKSIVYYWTAISLGPLFLVLAIGLTTSPHLKATERFLADTPIIGTVLFRLLPFVLLTLGFAVFYAVMPNARVHWKAALVGGAVGGTLWQLNNMFSVIYVSRAVTYSQIYGSLGIFPVFLVGLYFSWVIMLLGAQVAYAFQNRQAYVQEKQAERVNQRGREFLALRIMTYIAQRFQRGDPPAGTAAMAATLGIPQRLLCQLVTLLVQSHLLVEVLDREGGYTLARPLHQITAQDILLALRAGTGEELLTAEDKERPVVFDHFQRIYRAEGEVAGQITLQSLVDQTRPT